MKQGHSADGKGRGGTGWGLPRSLGLYGMCAASLAGACLYFFLAYVPARRAAAIKVWQQELAVRAELRKMTLDHWVAVGLADADILAVYPTPRALVPDGEGTLTASRAADAAAHLYEVAERFARMRDYHRFVLLDTNLRIVIGVGAAAQIERPDLQVAAEVLAQGKTRVNFHRYADGRVAVIFLARVGGDTSSRTGSGVVLLEADPNKWLYPYLAMRPMAASSAETVLLRREGDDILFLSPLRHNPAPPLTFRRPANVTGFAALAAVEGREGFSEYVDYRNEPVFAAVARLDHAPWGLVVKVDQREALADFRQDVRRTGATAVAVFVGFWALVFLLVLGWHKQAEAALREGEERFRLLFDNMLEGFAHCRMLYRDGRPDDFVFLAVNPAFETLTGLKNIVGKKVSEAIPGIRGSSPELFEVYGRVASTGKSERLDIYVGALGIWFNIAVYSFERGHFVAVFDNITERKRAEAALCATLARQETLLAAVPDIVMEVDTNKVYTWANKLGIDFFGGDVVGHEADFYFEGEQDTYARVHPLFQGDENTFYVESWQRRRDGEKRLLAWWCRVLKDGAGNVTGAISTARDITERKQAEVALRESEARFRDTFQRSTIGKSLTGADGRLLKVNQALADMLGYSIEELQQITFVDITHPDDLPESRECVRCLLAGERPTYQLEKRYRHRDGHFVFANVSTTLLRDTQEAPLYLVTDVVDISARKRAEIALAETLVDLERRVAERTAELSVSNQELESFTYAVSHDLRAPLRGIDGWTQAVLEDCAPLLDEQGRTHLARVRSEARRMDQLIDDLLELSRVTRASITRETVNLTAMVLELELGLRAGQPGRAVDLVVAPGVVAEGDAVLLRVVLQNLLHNAWKFSANRPRARIEFGCTSEQGRTVYHVRDDGAGFDMRYASKLFAPFQRLHSLAEFPGTGIGLATVQRIVHRHGGRVWVTAEVDRGATFYFTLTA